MSYQPNWLKTAYKEIGTLEQAGPKHNARIIEYHKSTSLKANDDETPWCSSFVNWCLMQNGIKGTDSAAARSFLNYGLKITEPAYGCIVVLKRGNNNKSGHVGFLIDCTTDKISILGGNQGNKVSVSNFEKKDLLSYRWPF